MNSQLMSSLLCVSMLVHNVCGGLLLCAFHLLMLTGPMTMRPLYAHSTEMYMCKQAWADITHGAKCLRHWPRLCGHTEASSSQKEEKGELGVIPSVRINHDAASPAPRGELPQAGYRRSFTGEDGLRRREGQRARHSTVHSGHIIMTLTRPAG